MSEKFHITAKGEAHQCFASVRPCPLGGAESHFASKDEARAAFEARNAGVTVAPGAKKGFTVLSLEYVGLHEGATDTSRGGKMMKLPIRGGFDTPKEAIDWAKDVLPEATSIISVENEDFGNYTFVEDASMNQDKMAGNWKSLNLIDISREKQVLDTGNVPAIAKHYLAQKGEIKNVHDLRLVTNSARTKLDAATYGRLMGYMKAATYGRAAKA